MIPDFDKMSLADLERFRANLQSDLMTLNTTLKNKQFLLQQTVRPWEAKLKRPVVPDGTNAT